MVADDRSQGPTSSPSGPLAVEERASTPQDGGYPLVIGRYTLYGPLSSGGMATVHVGKLTGQAGFVRTVAIKRLRPETAREPEFLAMFVDEARLVSRIRHPNVVPTLDVVAEGGELFLVMEYVHGESLSYLLRRTVVRKEQIPPDLVVSMMTGVLYGLHAAHEATHPKRGPLGIVHRDVSPQNVLVGVDGTTRVLDFGVAKALHRLHTTQQGMLKGKLRYMSPEQMLGEPVSRASDVYSAAVVAWEALTARPLFASANEQDIREAILLGDVPPPSEALPSDRRTVDHSAWPKLRALDAVVLRGLARDAVDRYPTARDFARALEAAVSPAPTSAVGAWVERIAAEGLATREARLAEAGERPARSDPPNEVVTQVATPSSPAAASSSPQEVPHPTSSRPSASSAVSSRAAPRSSRGTRPGESSMPAIWIALATATCTVLVLLVVAAVLLWRRG